MTQIRKGPASGGRCIRRMSGKIGERSCVVQPLVLFWRVSLLGSADSHSSNRQRQLPQLLRP